MNVNVDVFCGRENFSVSEEEIAAVVACLRESAPWKFPAGTLSVAFLGDDEICRMHEEFLSDPSKTDVITFPGDDVFSEPRLRLIPGEGGPDNLESDEDAFAGEICVCVDQAMRIAKELNISQTTVIFHRNNLCDKLGTRSIGKLTIYAVLSGIVSIKEI